MLQSLQHQYLLYFCCISGIIITDVKQREAQPAVFLTTPKRFVLVKKQSICVLTNGGLSVERGNDTKKPHMIYFQSFYDAFPLFPACFSLDAHHDCQWGRNCCRDTKELLKLHLWQLLQQGPLSMGQKGVIQNYSQRMYRKKSITAKALLGCLVCQQQISTTALRYFQSMKWKNYTWCQKYKWPLSYTLVTLLLTFI